MGLFAGTPFDRPPTCDRCGAVEADCRCPPLPAPRIPPQQQTARLKVQKRQRGKVVTVVDGLCATEPGDLDALAELLTQLKSTCGAGGALKEQAIEIQGDHLERIRHALSKSGYRVKI